MSIKVYRSQQQKVIRKTLMQESVEDEEEKENKKKTEKQKDWILRIAVSRACGQNDGPSLWPHWFHPRAKVSVIIVTLSTL